MLKGHNLFNVGEYGSFLVFHFWFKAQFSFNFDNQYVMSGLVLTSYFVLSNLFYLFIFIFWQITFNFEF